LEPDRDIPIEFTGKRPGEKIFERLWHESEYPSRTEFEKILVARTNGHYDAYLMKNLKEILELAEGMKREAMMGKINEVIPTYSSQRNAKSVMAN